MEIGWKLEILKMLWRRGVTVSHCMCSVYTCMCTHVCLYIERYRDTSFVFWLVLCQGCICSCVQMYFYSDLRHWMELCGCIYISAVARRTHLSYTSDSTFVFFALKHLSPIRQNFRNWSNFSTWFHVSALAKCGLKWSGAKWIQIFITNGSMDGQKMSQKLFSQPQRRSKHFFIIGPMYTGSDHWVASSLCLSFVET